MSTSSINTTSTLNYYSITINETINASNSGNNGFPANGADSVNGFGGQGQHHGGFYQSVVHALQGLGLNISGLTGGGNGASGVSSSASSGVDSDGDNDQSGSSSQASGNIQQLMHTFLHDLHQALNQAGQLSTQSAGTTGTSGTGTNSTDINSINSINSNSGSASTVGSATVNPYSNFSSSLSSLISSLTNGSQANTQLQTDFGNLVQALGGSSNSATLQSFLQQLQSNTQNGNSPLNGVNNLLQTSA